MGFHSKRGLLIVVHTHGREALFARYFRVLLIYEGPRRVWKYGGVKNNILVEVFLVGATIVDVEGKFCPF